MHVLLSIIQYKMCQLHLTHQYQYNIIKLEVYEYSIKINNVRENGKSY